MKALNFKTLVKTLFFDNLFTDFRFKKTLNVYLRSRKFISSFFLSLANLTALFLMI